MELKHWCRHTLTGRCNIHNINVTVIAQAIEARHLKVNIPNATYVINTILNQVWKLSV